MLLSLLVASTSVPFHEPVHEPADGAPEAAAARGIDSWPRGMRLKPQNTARDPALGNTPTRYQTHPGRRSPGRRPVRPQPRNGTAKAARLQSRGLHGLRPPASVPPAAAAAATHSPQVLRGSHPCSRLACGRGIAAGDGGKSFVNEKIRVLVRLDIDCASARIEVGGHVTGRSVQALCAVARRTNSLLPGLALAVDMSAAAVEPEAMALLESCSAAHRLPLHIDPVQNECRLSILTADRPATGRAHPAMAA